MATDNLREWALKGAEQRLVEIAAEARAIFVAFPELRDEGRGFDANGAAPAGGTVRTRGRRRRRMSAEGRKRISDAQRARWAKQKAGNGGAESAPARPARPSRKTAAAGRSRKKR